MDQTITIALPIHPALLGVFLGILAIMLVYYVVKFVGSIITGG